MGSWLNATLFLRRARTTVRLLITMDQIDGNLLRVHLINLYFDCFKPEIVLSESLLRLLQGWVSLGRFLELCASHPVVFVSPPLESKDWSLVLRR